MEWNKTQVTFNTITGSRTIRYRSGDYVIESRRRSIPHSGREGSWLHTTYFLIRPDGTEKEYYSMKDAKAAAEAAANG